MEEAMDNEPESRQTEDEVADQEVGAGGEATFSRALSTGLPSLGFILEMGSFSRFSGRNWI